MKYIYLLLLCVLCIACGRINGAINIIGTESNITQEHIELDKYWFVDVNRITVNYKDSTVTLKLVKTDNLNKVKYIR